MSFLTKLLPMLALVVSMGPFAAQARNVTYRYIAPSAPKRWATNFGCQPVSCKPSICTEVKTGFWPRPLDCAR